MHTTTRNQVIIQQGLFIFTIDNELLYLHAYIVFCLGFPSHDGVYYVKSGRFKVY